LCRKKLLPWINIHLLYYLEHPVERKFEGIVFQNAHVAAVVVSPVPRAPVKRVSRNSSSTATTLVTAITTSTATSSSSGLSTPVVSSANSAILDEETDEFPPSRSTTVDPTLGILDDEDIALQRKALGLEKPSEN
jgi:hypothetical protein